MNLFTRHQITRHSILTFGFINAQMKHLYVRNLIYCNIYTSWLLKLLTKLTKQIIRINAMLKLFDIEVSKLINTDYRLVVYIETHLF